MAATNPGCVKNQYTPGKPRLSATAKTSSLLVQKIKSGSAEHPDQDSESSMQSTADMTAFVQNLLVQMKTRFQAMSEGIVSKIDEMGSKIDKLEQSIKDLNAEMEGASKSKPEDDKPSDEPV